MKSTTTLVSAWQDFPAKIVRWSSTIVNPALVRTAGPVTTSSTASAVGASMVSRARDASMESLRLRLAEKLLPALLLLSERRRRHR